jgi:hypothetical protein
VKISAAPAACERQMYATAPKKRFANFIVLPSPCLGNILSKGLKYKRINLDEDCHSPPTVTKMYRRRVTDYRSRRASSLSVRAGFNRYSKTVFLPVKTSTVVTIPGITGNGFSSGPRWFFSVRTMTR